MAIWPYTDQEWDTHPCVILTSELDWDPGQLDLTLDDDEQLYDTINDLLPDPLNTLYDEFGDFCHYMEVQATTVTPLDDIINHCTYAAFDHDTTPDAAPPADPNSP